MLGAYPVRVDETCWLPAMDFDAEDWSTDALVYTLNAFFFGSVP
jgi:hypothetical protein